MAQGFTKDLTIDTDGTMAANSDSLVSSQKAIRTYVAANGGGVSDGDKGDITVSSSGTVWTVDAAAISNAKMANMVESTFKMRVTGSTGAPEDGTATQATAALNAMVGDSGSGGTKGLVPAPASGDAAASKFLKADGTWATAGGGSSAFSALTASTNTTAAMVVGSGASLTATGSGSIVATDVANASVIAKVLTGITTTAARTLLIATDTILAGFSMVNKIIADLAVNWGATTVATAAGTTTLTVSSNRYYQFTGITTQTVVLPDATTLLVGDQFTISDKSTGIVTINYNGGSLAATLQANNSVIIALINNSTSAGTWDIIAASNMVTGEVPSGTVNGSNVTFTLANTPNGGLMLFKNGVLMQSGSGNDYALSGSTITFATAPLTGAKLVANYGVGGTTPTQTITLTGDVTGSGSGSFAATIKSSVALAGAPTTTTQSQADNSTKIATTAYVDAGLATKDPLSSSVTTVVTGTSQAMAVNNIYIANNASQVTLTLPSTVAVGDNFNVVGLGAGGWKVAQNSGQTIRLLSTVSTSGTGGSVASTTQYDSLSIICVTANTDFRIINATSTGLNVV